MSTSQRSENKRSLQPTPREFEAYVAEIVEQFEEFSNATIWRNRRFPGLRQPGNYEIDVAVEITLGGTLKVLTIIECKRHSRPVDRPIVQKLAQTKDAIGAHKAVVVSPVGFTRSAVEVAEAHGIALWILAEAELHVVAYLRSFLPWPVTYQTLRMNLLKELGLSPVSRTSLFLARWQSVQWPRVHEFTSSDGTKISLRWGTLGCRSQKIQFSFDLPIFSVSESPEFLDERLVWTELTSELVEAARCSEIPEVTLWKERSRQSMKLLKLEAELVEKLLASVLASDPRTFYKVLEPTVTIQVRTNE